MIILLYKRKIKSVAEQAKSFLCGIQQTACEMQFFWLCQLPQKGWQFESALTTWLAYSSA